jgi:hypothetical protein
MKLRIGQANDSLEKLRVALGHKMILFRTSVRNSTSQRTRTRAWAEVDRVDTKVRKSARSYRQAQLAMTRLGASQETLMRYQVIKPKDLKLNGDVVEENWIGQRNDRLAWFWKLGGHDDDNNWMQECESFNPIWTTHIMKMAMQYIVLIGLEQRQDQIDGARN